MALTTLPPVWLSTRLLVGWSTTVRSDDRWVSARQEEGTLSATAIACAAVGFAIGWHYQWMTIPPEIFAALSTLFWIGAAIGVVVVGSWWRVGPAIKSAEGPVVVSDHGPIASIARPQVIILAVMVLGGGFGHRYAPWLVTSSASLLMMLTAGYHFGRSCAIGRRERATSTTVLRPRSIWRRVGRTSLRSVPAPSSPSRTSRLWRILLVAALVTSAFLVTDLTGPTDAYPFRTSRMDAPALWAFPARECTSYVAWRIRRDDHVPFTNFYRGAYWGNAANWATVARAVGVPTDGHATSGSVVVLQPGVDGAGTPGHVAIVVSVTKNYVLVDDYNWGARGTYSRHWLAHQAYPSMTFLHFPSATGA
jgi:surface antigen